MKVTEIGVLKSNKHFDLPLATIKIPCGTGFPSPAENTQFNLFTKIDHCRNEKLMKAFDKINCSWGSQTIRSAASGLARPWAMKRGKISPRYTTSWDEILNI